MYYREEFLLDTGVNFMRTCTVFLYISFILLLSMLEFFKMEAR
jgi:hypothetical protein